MGEGGSRRMMEQVDSSMIYCKNFCKCHNVNVNASLSTTIKKDKKEEIF
jgi:hypothetical protein